MRGPDMATHYYKKSGIALYRGDSREVLRTFPDSSIDAIICDPPYPCIVREYGRLTEAEWHDLMRAVVAECRRILKPRGSAVFILQPNSERVGRMRPWLFEFQAWACREWNMIQDAWWWNTATMPGDYGGLMRSSLKACVWLGSSDCYRDLDAVLWDEALMSRVAAVCARARNAGRETSPSGRGVNRSRVDEAARRRGGVTPFNVIPTTHGQGKSPSVAGSYSHGAGTPMALVEYWVRYISPPDGVVCDPFMGSGTCGLAALKRNRSFIGIESFPKYYTIAERRVAEARAEQPLFAS
jgi:DNA modification methylase